MGNPQHYSVKLPGRCLALINGLWPEASKLHGGENPELGPLTSTFLVSMSMPILTIPLERVERQIDKALDQAYADDRHLGPKAAAAADCRFGMGKLEGLNILRISETDYRQFLEAWVAWLGATKIAKMAAA